MASKSTRSGSSKSAHKLSSASRKPTRSDSAHASAATHSATSRETTASRRRSSSKSRQASSYHPGPQQPTQDRYREIQQALADRGYFSGPVDGVWGASSVDALKRFQHDQNLDEDGKIGSLALIALGLGPQREAVVAKPKVIPNAGGSPDAGGAPPPAAAAEPPVPPAQALPDQPPPAESQAGDSQFPGDAPQQAPAGSDSTPGTDSK